MNNADQPSVQRHHNKSAPGILVTRAKERSAGLVEDLNSGGFRAVELPCLTIHPIPVNTDSFSLQNVDAVIFTSYHAVESMHSALPFPWTHVDSQVFAIGPATAEQLAELKQNITRQPVHPYNSEALLTFKEFENGENKTAAVVKGKGGRDHLQQELPKRGFRVCMIDSYERVLPEYDTAAIDAVFEPGVINAVTVTSNEVLQNLLQLAGARHKQYVLGLPLVVGSPRAATLAGELGFNSRIVVAKSPGDTDMLSAVQQVFP